VGCRYEERGTYGQTGVERVKKTCTTPSIPRARLSWNGMVEPHVVAWVV